MSIFTEKENRALVCYGDSITAQDWPDYLKLRCEREAFSKTSVIRRAASRSRILREYQCFTYESYGLKGSKRFSHEVPTDGADVVLIQQGINGFIRKTDLIDGYVDFDRALRAPKNPDCFLAIYDSGDQLHPSKAGYERMAEIVPIELLR